MKLCLLHNKYYFKCTIWHWTIATNGNISQQLISFFLNLFLHFSLQRSDNRFELPDWKNDGSKRKDSKRQILLNLHIYKVGITSPILHHYRWRRICHKVLKHSREERVTAKRQLTDWHFHLLWPKVRRHCQMCFCVSAGPLRGTGQAVATGSHQFLAAMTTDKATPPMATAVAPKSHFQLRPWGNRSRVHVKQVEWFVDSLKSSNKQNSTSCFIGNTD